MNDKWFYILSAGFILGVFLRSFFDWGWPVIFLFSLLSLAILLYAGIFTSSKTIRNAFILSSLFLFIFALGVFRFHISDQATGDPLLEQRVGEKITVEGVIIDEPDERERNVKLTIALEEIFENGTSTTLDSKVLATTELYPKFNYGDKVKVVGKLQKPKKFETDTGKEFDYISYLAKDKIYYQISFADVELISRGHGKFIRRNLFALKRSFLEKLARVIPDPESALMGGLLLGTKQSLGKELKQDFIDTGIVHIVVLSGYNVTIVSDAIVRFFGYFLSGMVAFSLGIISIIFFVVMTGAGATIVRAGIMAILVLIARRIGRTYEITRALALAGIAMIIHNPWILVFDISFQLSFLATVGLIYLAPRFEKYVRFLPKFWDIRGIFAATIATQLFVLPFILYKMGTLSLVAPIVNLLVLPAVPATMFFGFLTGVGGFITHALSVPFAWISYGLLHYAIVVVKFFADLPFAAVAAKSFPLILVILIYAVIGWYLMIGKSKIKNQIAK